MSIYQQLGQEHGISTAVDEFYRRVLDDPDLQPYFTGVDLPSLRRHQVLLLSQVTGGPARYEGRDLHEAHAHLGVTGEHFDRVVAHLAATLEHLGVDAPTIATIAGVLGEHRDAIVAREPVA